MFIRTDTVHRALRHLKGAELSRVGRVSLFGYLVLKAKLPSAEGAYILASTGEASVGEQLDKFVRFGTTDDGYFYLNPFGTSEEHLEFLTPGYERRGTYTQLATGRNLEWLAPEREGNRYRIRIPAAAATTLAEKLRIKIPARATAAFFMRGWNFPDGTNADGVVTTFREIFRLRQTEYAAIFHNDSDFIIDFRRICRKLQA